MSRRLVLPLLLCALAWAGAGCGSDKGGGSGPAASTPAASASTPAPASTQPVQVATKPKVGKLNGPAPTQLVVKDLRPGSGRPAQPGDALTLQYVGVLAKNGKQIDSTWDSGQPFSFQLGAGDVLPGWNQGLVGIRPGGRRELVIPSALAYGPQGAPPDIPPNAPLIFVIDLQRIG